MNNTLIGSAQGLNLTWYSNSSSITGQDNTPDIPTYLVGNIEIYVSQTENNCESNKASYTVTIDDIPFFILDDSLLLCSWESAYVGESNHDWYFIWNDGVISSPRTITEEGIYTLTANNACGSFSDSIIIIKDQCNCYFYLPNAFTPNGDLFNARYKPVYDCCFKEYEMRIFNRWGEVVFSTKNPAEGWDGTYSGSYVGDGVYMVQVFYIDQKAAERREIYNGHLVLIR